MGRRQPDGLDFEPDDRVEHGRFGEDAGRPHEKVRLVSPYIGGGFGGKLFLRADVVLASLAAREVRRPVKVALQRPLMPNNTTHRPATIQRIRLGATKDGKLAAIAHESWSGDQPGGEPETAVSQTRLLYAGENRMTAMRLAVLDLPEGNAMRAPGEAPGMMALEIAMDEMAEKLGLDPIEFRIRNDTQVAPDNPAKPESDDPQSKAAQAKHIPHPPFSQRQFVQCLRLGAERFDWNKRNPKPAQARDGRWLPGMGVAAAFRNNLLMKSAARVRLDNRGAVTVETGHLLDHRADRGGDDGRPARAGRGEARRFPLSHLVWLRWTMGRQQLDRGRLRRLHETSRGRRAATGFRREGRDVRGWKSHGRRAQRAARPSRGPSGLVAEDAIEYGDPDKKFRQSTFGAHFAEVGVNAVTGETRVRRMLAVCAAGRILNPKSARSQVIGGMTMGVGGALMEDLVVDKRVGFFVNHDLASYEVPVHADIPHQDVIFLDETDPISSPMKAKGVGELGICGVGAAVANAIYNATGIRVRDYPITLDKLLDRLPPIA